MLHEKSSASAGLFSCSKLFSPPALRAAPEGATGGDPQTPALTYPNSRRPPQGPQLNSISLVPDPALTIPTRKSQSRSMCP